MREEPTRWIDGLPAALDRHVGVLRRLFSEAQADERIRILVVGCSIGRGVADEHSDIDAYMAVLPEYWLRYLDEVPEMVGRLGNVMDQSQKRVVPSGQEPYQLAWAVYEDGVQLELVIAQAQSEVRPRRDWVILHDPDGRVGERQPDRFATPAEVCEWAYDAWSTLLLCAKYLSRESLWEALETLHSARTQVWRLWAAARRVPDAQYGLTAVLDSDDPTPPPGIEATHAPLERDALVRAALTCADLLKRLWPEAMAAVSGSAKPVPKAADAARRKLAGLLR